MAVANAMTPTRARRKVWPCVVAALLLSLGAGLMIVRKEAGGLRNVFSRAYWAERMSGDDLFSHKSHVFKRGNRDHREICLTIDDGPHPASCAKILDILAQHDIRVTFFLVGTRIKDHPELVRRMLEEGHEVGNHTQDHLRLDSLPANQVHNEIVNCETNFHRATGQRMYLFRPPGMRFNDEVIREALAQGYVTVSWDVGAKDFTAAHAKPEEIVIRVLKQLDNGVIVLLHDTPETAEALPEILDGIENQGYRILTATEMMERLPNPVRVPTNAFRVNTR
ncbi:MAG: polysaccharide deacetylase family protein [Fimbriimonas ginsengisoli]|uniref:Polysaccharide deacetylase family protein n=1 Tax=Fimbriimonas ginsengisoli TaxID=1005039 RepID=A0A931PWT7_FIMGI|nr:polysaccharide deacetylase family protein [Fimbriimonas ginsengisoli]